MGNCIGYIMMRRYIIWLTHQDLWGFCWVNAKKTNLFSSLLTIDMHLIRNSDATISSPSISSQLIIIHYLQSNISNNKIMSIIYALVGKGERIFAQHTNFSGNFALTATQVVKACDDRKFMKYAAGNYIFYVLNAQCVFLVMCERSYSQRIAFNFLETIRKMFTNLFNSQKIAKAKMYEMIQFGAVLKTQIQLYNVPEQVDKVAELMKQTEQVSKIIQQDLQKLLLRGQKIQVLVRKTESMQELSYQMKKSSRAVRNQMAFENYKMKIIVVLVVILVIYLILVLSCDGFALSGCF